MTQTMNMPGGKAKAATQAPTLENAVLSFLRKALRAITITLLAVTGASIARVLFLSALETRIVWVTFYPAVIIAALNNGLPTGLLTSAASCLIAIYGWPLFCEAPFIKDYGDWLGLAAFLFNGLLISIVAEMSRRARERANQARQEAENANKAKSTFLATMSHELRTPLNAILGFSSLMRNDLSIPEERRKTLQIIHRSGEHLLKLINDVLDMARIEAGRTELKISVIDVQSMIRDLVYLMRPRAEARGIELLFEDSAEFPHWVRTDEAKLRQVVTNLIGNAIKFTEGGYIAIRLHASALETEQSASIRIEVEDTGIGIAPEDQPRVFEPFVQAAQGASQKGAGLGLAITRQFVEIMGGRITLDSQIGHGSTFTVEMPVALVDAQDLAASLTAEKSAIGLEPGQPDYRILIVEDNVENWLLLRQILQKVGLDVKVVENGRDAVAMFQSWHPHFIWMDCRMPGMDGLEAARRIRALEDGRKVKIVALTASVFKEERENVIAAGMDDLIRKPFRLEEIYACLERFLGARFIYSESVTNSAPVADDTQALKDLMALPLALRSQLADSIKRLNRSDIARVVDQVSEQNPTLGSALERHTARLKYTPILQALQSIRTPPGEPRS